MTARGDHWVIEPLGKQHDRAAFSCGVPALDEYLRRQARQDARRHMAAPFVLVERGDSVVAGYYTLSQVGVDIGMLPADVARKLPKYPVGPVTLLGRLAVDGRLRGRGLGEFLLMDALRRSWSLSGEIAAMAVVVEAMDGAAAAFYEAYEFRRFPEQEHPLFLPMSALDRLFSEASV